MSHAANKRSPATVALDLRHSGQVAAVAVDGQGTVAAWTVVSDAGDPVALARRALRELRVRPREVRILIGAGEVQTAVLSQAGMPAEGEVAAALFAEGYERLREPAISALALAPGAWLVAAAGAATIEPLADGLLEESGTEPLFVVDQLLAVEDLAAGSGSVDYGETGLLIAAKPPGSPAFVRFLPPGFDVEEAARESRESLAAAGFASTVQVLGSQRDVLARRLAESGVAVSIASPPELPEACELAWRLALRPAVTRLVSPRGERRRASLAWARRASRAAMVIALLGALAMAAGMRLAWRNRALTAQVESDARLARDLREIGALAGEAKRLRAELACCVAPWPRVAETVAALARQLPPETAWERLQVKDGTLELEAAASGAAAGERLDLLRHTLERSPGILNLSWGAPAHPQDPRPRQVFRATVTGIAPQEAP
jgi:hypothetical protein